MMKWVQTVLGSSSGTTTYGDVWNPGQMTPGTPLPSYPNPQIYQQYQSSVFAQQMNVTRAPTAAEIAESVQLEMRVLVKRMADVVAVLAYRTCEDKERMAWRVFALEITDADAG